MARLARFLHLLVVLALLGGWLRFAPPAGAQSYSFAIEHMEAGFDIQPDASLRVIYIFDFINHSGYQPIDFVDVGLPGEVDPNAVKLAYVDNQPVSVSRSEYQGEGTGVAVVLGEHAIPPGQSGRVRLEVAGVRPQFFVDDRDPQYASVRFTPTWFGEPYVVGETDMLVSVRFPTGVQTGDPRWHAAPNGWSSQPETSLDENGQIIYTWSNPQARATGPQVFGVSLPAGLLPAGAVARPTLYQRLGVSAETFYTWLMCGGSLILVVGGVGISAYRSRRRKTQYLPPRISIEGLGIKRGLTAVEAAVLLEEPLDKILTMILFGVLRKGAAEVISHEPLDLKVTQPFPGELYEYEKDFLKAFLNPSGVRRSYLQDVIVDLVETVEKKTSDFSRRETVAYYRDVVRRAWQQVETAGTPEIKSQVFAENAEWMMMDRNYARRAEDVFSEPVTPPAWWQWSDPDQQRSGALFRPVGSGSSAARPPEAAGMTGGSPAATTAAGSGLPVLPGASFAASLVRSVQDFSVDVVGNVTEFTEFVTQRTNPQAVHTPASSHWDAPVLNSSQSIFSSGETRGSSIWSSASTSSSSRRSSSRSSSSSRSCACACACAGCACACAGGGR